MSLLAAAIILLAAAGCYTSKVLTPVVINEQTALYSCTVSASGSYEAELFENKLFPEGVLGEDRLYANSLVDRLNIKFSADYSGSQTATLRGDYSIVATVQGYQGSNDARKIIYTRDYPIIENKAINGETDITISESVSLSLDTYHKFADEADLILNSRLGREAVVTFHGVFLAGTEYGDVSEPFSYSIQIPLTNDLFSITKEAPISITDSIVESLDRQVTPAQGFSAILLLSWFPGIAALLILIFFTKLPTAKEQSVLTFKSIQRKHGSRTVNLSALPSIPAHTQVCVADLDSLVRISDERQQLICYSLNEEGLPVDGLLYVSDGDKYYLLHLEIEE